MRRTFSAIAIAAMCTPMLSGSLQAQVERSGGGASQKMMEQYQQLAAERTALQEQNAQMKKDLDKAKADLAAATKERDALKSGAGNSAAAIAQANQSKLAADKSLDEYKKRLTEVIAKFREMAQTLKDVEVDRTTARKELADRNAAFDKCADDNYQLYKINNEVLDRYEHVGVFSRVAEREPFTGIERNRMENLVDGYREHAEQLRVKKPVNRPAPPTNKPIEQPATQAPQ